MDLSDSMTIMLIETAKALTGSARRLFMARTVKELGPGGQQRAARAFGWGRMTIRKGLRELEHGVICVDAFRLCGRKWAEDHLPNLLTDIRALVDSQSQTGPQFRTQRLYIRLTAAEVRRQLIAQNGYTDPELPTAATISAKLNALGYYRQIVAKSPPKKVPETDAIFDQLAVGNRTTDADAHMLRVSLDAKATVKVGPFARGGKSHVPTAAADHNFQPVARGTPVGILLPALDELFLYGITSKVTSDCLADCLDRWWDAVSWRFAHIRTLVINLDNGPENHSRRTQFMQQIVRLAHRTGRMIRLAYYPPYHSKYNPIERCWGILETHWNGTVLDSIDTVIQCARTMTWKVTHPVVEWVTTTYATGVRLRNDAMAALEAQITRLPGVERWRVDIIPAPLIGLAG
jgi:hypothetical protein